ncbi:uncharacterized protein ALTATR162_LOCUS11663 [Alternaria atra]|uniref:Uncharacterized protein n=1 Tax=Alternaria atra TaxID=119953 RepID=A0A8J2N5R6_9PLEO|nr:uncharacterized protein ALTATR162_LOCUS11663 [Alternaria atra]CAG5186664.1 unnamed protein product [Alternaria atra]
MNNRIVYDNPLNFGQMHIDFVVCWMTGGADSETTRGHERSLYWEHSMPNGTYRKQQTSEDNDQDQQAKERDSARRSRVSSVHVVHPNKEERLGNEPVKRSADPGEWKTPPVREL